MYDDRLVKLQRIQLLLVLTLAPIASHALTAQAARFEITPEAVLVDERFRASRAHPEAGSVPCGNILTSLPLLEDD